jgi:hypothetical protein
MIAFRLDPPAAVGGIGRENYFWNIASLLWPPKSTKPFLRHPWAEKMIHELCKRQYLGVVGCASSGKTDAAAVWGIINWLCDPVNSLVLLTSTSLKDSRKRIWGSATAYFQASVVKLPGKLKDSVGMIGTIDENTGEANNDKSGIALIAGEKKKEKEAIGKLIGMKNKHVFLIADELPELSEALMEAAYSNLTVQVGEGATFQMVGIGNFNSIYDPLGVFVRPKGGYKEITEDSLEWETEKGYCIRFDGLKSPNILEGRSKENEYPCYNSRHLKEHRNNFGENSAGFWRMCRSFPSPIGWENVIYSDADMIAGNAMDQVTWMFEPTPVSALDPAFTNDGDRAIQIFGRWGKDSKGIWVLQYDEVIPLHDNASVKVPRDYQIARLFRDNCIKRAVSPENCGLDSTGAGAVLLSIIHEEWNDRVAGINFSGKASQLQVSATDPTLSCDKYDRRVSELWWVGREFMKYGQIKGVTDDMAREMKARKYDTVKGAEGLRVRVETKKDMKKRISFSPDIADCAFVMLDLCRTRFGALAGGISTGQSRGVSNWKQLADKAHSIYESDMQYSDGPYA